MEGGGIDHTMEQSSDVQALTLSTTKTQFFDKIMNLLSDQNE
jgi:hypothetical protein